MNLIPPQPVAISNDKISTEPTTKTPSAHTYTIADKFSRAATQYDKKANIQQCIATAALNNLPASIAHKVLDVGCGTGRHTQSLFEKGAEVTGVDIAEGMLAFARQSYPHLHFAQGSAEQLPVLSSTFDWVFSSMALQWCPAPEQVAQEFYRVLNKGGQAELAIMLDGSFTELHKARALARLHPVNIAMPSAAQWLTAFLHAGFRVSRLITKVYVDKHKGIMPLLGSIKHVGAGGTASPAQSLTKRDIAKLDLAYRNLPHEEQQENALHLSYHVSHFRLEKL